MWFFRKEDKLKNILGVVFNLMIGLLIFLVIIAIILTIIIFLYLIIEKKFENKVYPGVHLKNIDLSSMTYDQVNGALKQEIGKINQNGVAFYYHDANSKKSEAMKKTTVYPLVSSLSGDIAYEVINFDLNKTIEEAFAIGRGGTFLNNLLEKIDSYANTKEVNLYMSVNEEQVGKILKTYFDQFEVPAKNAELLQKKDILNKIVFAISKEQDGRIIDYDSAIDKLVVNLQNLNTSPIEILSTIDKPDVYQIDGYKTVGRANEILSFAPFKLTYKGNEEHEIEERDWLISRDELAAWLVIKKGFSKAAEVGLNGAVEEYLENNIHPVLNIEPLDAKLEVANGRVTEFQMGTDGLSLDSEATLVNLENRIIKRVHQSIIKETLDAKNIEIVSKVIMARHISDVNDLGIKEVIGTGKSNFAGSPFNRRHNIKTGINTLNGIIIEPGEEFSLVGALGEIDGEHDYKPELVIKGGKTLPEFGGGLCQVGTTLFRTVLGAGLPVTERRNHSYRVGYYEPAGTDATIYDPWPDFKFLNDTDKYLLLQTYMEDNELRFELWGTQDGRIASTTEPTIYNIVEPGPTKIIETTDLEPGKRKCTESAHSGADAYFDYSVLYKDDTLKERRFKSHYVPWQEVCLVGVEELSATTTTETIIEGEPDEAPLDEAL